MLCPPPPTLNPVTIFEAARLPHRANPSRAAGSFFGQIEPSDERPVYGLAVAEPQKATRSGRRASPVAGTAALDPGCVRTL